MIYKRGYFKKELRMAYVENRISSKNRLFFGLFIGFFSISLHLILLTLKKSVLTDAVPHIMQQSYFSSVYIYINAAIYLFSLYYIVYYDYLSFTEIRKNRWYLLVKMGYSPQAMILSKLAATCYTVLTIYTTGFAVTVIMTVFLKYSPMLSYLPALYLVGLIDFMVLDILLVTSTLFIKQKSVARYYTIICVVALRITRYALDYHQVVSNKSLMQSFFPIFDYQKSLYMPFCALLVLLCFVVCFIKARDIAKYYSMPYDTYGYVMPENAVIIRRDSFSGRIHVINDEERIKRRNKMFDAAVNSALILVAVAAFVFNAFILIISTAQPGKEVTVFGVIPYIFASNTMDPAISENDLAYFKRIDENEQIETGDIVLFKKENVVYVERVIARSGNQITVDIDYYPPSAQKDSMKQEIDRGLIYGVFIGRSRWLGALILFANSVFGRITFLLIPLLVLYFYKQIKSFIINSVHRSDDD